MDRSLILAFWTLRRLRSEELPPIATEWLDAGLDSPALRELAGITSPIMSEAGPVFDNALRELRFNLPSKGEALNRLAAHYAQQIVDGQMSPHEGAGRIWWEVSNSFEHPSQLLLTFVGCASELDELEDRMLEDGHDRKKYARELEETIIASARELLEKGPNKSPEPTPGSVTLRATSGDSE